MIFNFYLIFFPFETRLTAWKKYLDLYLSLGRSIYSEENGFWGNQGKKYVMECCIDCIANQF